MRWLAGVLLILLQACAPSSPPAPLPPAPRAGSAPLPPAPPCERIVRIEVDKSERLLRAWCARGRQVEMTAAMGRAPEGHKQKAGDFRTPEGRYRVAGRPQPSRFRAFLPIDYPSVEDANQALAEGRIGPRDHARIVRAHERGELPPWDTPIGGEIGLHGEGERWAGDTRYLNWTLGCVAVSDEDLDFLLARVEPGIPFDIFP